MATNSEYLGKVRLFERLEEDKVEAFAALCRRKQLEKGEVLFLEGEPPDALYVIVSGRIRIERISPNGIAQVLATRSAGEAIGEMGLIVRTGKAHVAPPPHPRSNRLNST